MILEWKDVYRKNYHAVIQSGILDDDECRTFTVVFTGEEQSINELKAIFKHPKILFSFKSDDVKSHEYHGINEIQKLSVKYCDDKHLYFHSKGITRNGAAADWVEYLEFFNIHNYKTCLDKLDQCDVVGTEYLGPPKNKHHMSGNFWWTKSSHLHKLVVPPKDAPRHQFEWFILNTKKTTIWNFHSSKNTKGFPGFNTKRRKYEKHEYNNITQGNVVKINH